MDRNQFRRVEGCRDSIHKTVEWRGYCLPRRFIPFFVVGILALTSFPTYGSSDKDLGNTNFSIHLPRISFNRKATSEIILRAVRSLGIDAHLNERHDIVVGTKKISHPDAPHSLFSHRLVLCSFG